MGHDIFICGSCQVTFHDVNSFFQHKLSCGAKTDHGGDGETLQEQYEEVGEHQFTTEYKIVEIDGQTVEAISLDPSLLAEGQQVIFQTQTEPEPPRPPKRRAGRPRKGESKAEKEAAQRVALPKKPDFVEPDASGKIVCPNCKKSFQRQRHFKSHKCFPTSEYVDLTKKESLGSDAEDQSDEEEEEKPDKDAPVEFKETPKPTGRGRGRPRGKTNQLTLVREAQQKEAEAAANVNPPLPTDGVANVETQPEGMQPTMQEFQGKPLYNGVRPVSNDDDYVPPGGEVRTTLEQIPDLPVFMFEEEKMEFDENLSKIDYSVIEGLYKIHVIEQDVNENASVMPASRYRQELSVFSCNVCNKVFKSLSHMKLHCFIHTDLKPFTCHICNYSSNSKGNLYSHMRHHTGMYFRCNHCKFKTINKAHLAEHEGIHSSEKHECNLCHRSYNTLKSLINHVRKYHNSSTAGKNYLSTFRTHKGERTVAVLHQCHICNRKFKKKIDRDRHLYTHNLRDIPDVKHVCELCEFTASNQCFLDKHYLKHRVVYCCSLCDRKALSNTQLLRHLERDHSLADTADNFAVIHDECIGKSMYLSEPDGGFSESGTPVASAKDATENKLSDGSAHSTANEVAMTDGVTEDEPQEAEIMTDVAAEAAAAAGITEETVQEANAASDSMQQGEQETEEETVETSEQGLQEPDNSDNQENKDIYERLGYQYMNMQVFEKMRSTFGNEECEYCGRLFYNKGDFDTHVRTHTGEKPFLCEICKEYRANTKDHLKRHIEKEHEKVQYICNECDYVATSRTQLWYHQRKHKEPNASCPYCPFKCNNLKKLRLHLRVKHPDVDKEQVQKLTGTVVRFQGRLGKRTFKCPYCEKTFMRTGADLQKHIWIHEGIKPFKCRVCAYACRSKTNLMNHMLRHSDNKPFSCSHCGKAYKSKTALRWHVRSHANGKVFKCNKCPYEAAQNSHLKRHMETHEVKKRFLCSYCDYSANTMIYMKIHHTRHHPEHAYDSHVVTDNPSELPSHTKLLNLYYKTFHCLTCDYVFGNLPDMRRHLKTKHHLQVDDVSVLEKLNPNQVTQIQYSTSSNTPAEVQVMVTEGTGQDLEGNQDTETVESTEDNIIEHIIDVSPEDVLEGQELSMKDGMLSVNPTVILQEDRQQVVHLDPTNYQLDENQYIIQYVTPDGEVSESYELPPGSVLPSGTILDNDQVIQQVDESVLVGAGESMELDNGQIIYSEGGEASQLMYSEGEEPNHIVYSQGEGSNQIIYSQGESNQVIYSQDSGQNQVIYSQEVEPNQVSYSEEAEPDEGAEAEQVVFTSGEEQGAESADIVEEEVLMDSEDSKQDVVQLVIMDESEHIL